MPTTEVQLGDSLEYWEWNTMSTVLNWRRILEPLGFLSCSCTWAIWFARNLGICLHHIGLDKIKGLDNDKDFLDRSCVTILWQVWKHRKAVCFSRERPNPLTVLHQVRGYGASIYDVTEECRQSKNQINVENGVRGRLCGSIGIFFLWWIGQTNLTLGPLLLEINSYSEAVKPSSFITVLPSSIKFCPFSFVWKLNFLC